MKRCPIAAKIAGSIGILPCCILNDFFTKGMNVCPFCEASLSHHTLYTLHVCETWSPRIHVSCISLLVKKRLPPKKKTITAPILKPTYDQKQETLLFDLTITSSNLERMEEDMNKLQKLETLFFDLTITSCNLVRMEDMNKLHLSLTPAHWS